MKKERKASARAEQAARARLWIKARLGWLGGHPGEVGDGRVGWRGARVAEIDRTALASAARALGQLRRDFADVLPVVVGEVAAWFRAVETGLDALGRAIHHGAALPDLFPTYPRAIAAQAVALGAARPALRPAIRALGWMRLGDAKAAARDLGWLGTEAPSLDAIIARDDGLDLVVLLLGLAADEGEHRVAPLVALVGDPAIDTVRLELRQHADDLRRDIKARKPRLPTPPATVLAPIVLALARWLPTQERSSRRLALRALATADLPEYLARLAASWVTVERATAQARSQLRRDHGDRIEPRLEMAYETVVRAIQTAPPKLDRHALATTLRAPSAAVLDTIDALPDSPWLPPRVSLLLALDGAPPPALPMIRAHAAVRRDAAWLTPLAPFFDGDGYICGEIQRRLDTPASWRRFGHVLAHALRDGLSIEETGLIRLAAVVARIPDERDAAATFAAFEAGPEIDPRAIDAALALGPHDPRLAAALQRDLDDLPAVVRRLAAAAPDAHALVASLVIAGDRTRLVDAAGLLELARALALRGLPTLQTPPRRRTPAWARRYPEALHGALSRITDPAVAARVLADAFPDDAKLRTELAAIDERLAARPDERLAKRRANLAARLVSPPAPSPAKLARLEEELVRAAGLAAIDRWIAAAEARVDSALPAALGLPAAPPWLADRGHRAVILGILALDGADRALAHRLLAARTGPPPWDLRDAAPNRAFVDRLAGRGLDPAPWLDGIGAHRHGELTLELEADPLAVLAMGAHFKTCLSPGAVNFFSTIVNAADINKRVIYARAGGTIAGRCLIALTAAGGIVTFEPYEHGKRDFPRAVRDFVAELASRMRTLVLPGGPIPRLLGKRWYDDGAHDLTGQFAFLSPGSDFCRELMTIDPGELLAALEHEFAPIALGGLALGLVVALPALATRPSLILPLAPRLLRADDLPLAARVTAADLAERAGRPDLVAPLLTDHIEAHARERHAAHGWVDDDLHERFAAVAPSRLLAFLRDTGERRGRRDDDGGDPHRLYAAGCAHLALGRKKRAADLFRRAASCCEGLTRRAQARLDSLAAA